MPVSSACRSAAFHGRLRLRRMPCRHLPYAPQDMNRFGPAFPDVPPSSGDFHRRNGRHAPFRRVPRPRTNRPLQWSSIVVPACRNHHFAASPDLARTPCRPCRGELVRSAAANSTGTLGTKRSWYRVRGADCSGRDRRRGGRQTPLVPHVSTSGVCRHRAGRLFRCGVRPMACRWRGRRLPADLSIGRWLTLQSADK